MIRHHATDPACGKLLNAFDIVRVHRFRDLDDKAPSDTPIGKLPSYSAMTELALTDDRVKAVFAEDRMSQASAEFTDEDWQNQLELDRTGDVKDTLTNICIILRHDPNLQNIVFNQFKSMLDVTGKLPWPQVKPGWSDTDVACAKLYFEKTYPCPFYSLKSVYREVYIFHPKKLFFCPILHFLKATSLPPLPDWTSA